MPNPFELTSSTKLRYKVDVDKRSDERKISLVVDGVPVGIENFSPADKLRVLNERLTSETGLPADFTVTSREGVTRKIAVTFRTATNENQEMLFIMDDENHTGFFNAKVENGRCTDLSKGYLDDISRRAMEGMNLMVQAHSLMDVHLRSMGVTKAEAFISTNNPDQVASLKSSLLAPNIIEGGYHVGTAKKEAGAVRFYIDLASTQQVPPNFDQLLALLQS